MELASLLEREHGQIKSLLEKLADTSEGAVKTRQKLFDQVRSDLALHATIEEQHLYPAVARIVSPPALADAAEDEHRALHRVLEEMAALPVDGEAFMQKVEELTSAVEDHVEREEREILPQLERAVGEAELEAIADRLEAEKRRLMASAR